MKDGEYQDGEKHGYWTTYYANGNKRSEGMYDRGKKEGIWIQYWPNGSKKTEGRFVGDKFTGKYMAYHENGQRAHEGMYNEHRGVPSDGTKEGPWHYYEDDGETIWRTITYHRGARTKPDDVYKPRDAEA